MGKIELQCGAGLRICVNLFLVISVDLRI